MPVANESKATIQLSLISDYKLWRPLLCSISSTWLSSQDMKPFSATTNPSASQSEQPTVCGLRVSDDDI